MLWLIDLDNTLYDASWRVMGEINQRMTRYVAKELNLSIEDASCLREKYWHRYGATLLGLIRHHNICAADFLKKTHPHEELTDFVRRVRGERARLERLPGRKWLLTNAPSEYAMHILKIMGVHRSFERVITIEDMRFGGSLRPKPSQLLFRQVLRKAAIPAHCITVVDDHDENLMAAHRLGFRTARIWASGTMLARARHSGRPLQVRRPSYVKLQVHSLQALARFGRAGQSEKLK